MTGPAVLSGIAGRVAIVTGARRGIGLAIAQALTGHGAHVLICGGSDAAGITAAAERLAAVGGVRVAGLAVDLTRDNAAEQVLRSAQERLGPVDVLINNAGGFVEPHTTVETSREEWDRLLAVNLTSAFLLTRCCLPGMLERGWGRIVNVASEVAVAPMLGNAIAYTAAKAGLIAFTKQLALETASRGVTANAVNPGTIATEHLQYVFDGSGVDPASLKATIPMGRFGHPDEVAGLVPYLVSDQGAYCSGATFNITGGRLTA